MGKAIFLYFVVLPDNLFFQATQFHLIILQIFQAAIDVNFVHDVNSAHRVQLNVTTAFKTSINALATYCIGCI